MAGLTNSGLNGIQTPPHAGAELSSLQHFRTIAWLRWRIFVNSLRGKGARGELVAKILSYPLLALMVIAPAVGAGIGSWYFVSQGQVHLLTIVLWIIFALWQLIGVNTSTTGPSFDLSSLIRFPIRYRDYFFIRLSFGLMDPPTLAGIACLISMCVGIGIANVKLLPWSILALSIYGACNILFSRMIYSWLERWLAQRRTRELMTGLIVLCSIGFQFLAQFAQRLGHHGVRGPQNPLLLKAAHILFSINWFLPPGLTAASIDHIHQGLPLIAIAALTALAAYTLVFLLILHMRLHAQFHGEDLSEAPAPALAKPSAIKSFTGKAASNANSRGLLDFLPSTVAACLIKEIRYLLRSGPKAYVLIMPVFVVFLFSMRTSGLNFAGVDQPGVKGMLFAYGCAYTQLIFVSLIYNSLGGDGAGVQFYFIAPLRMRDVILAKNLMTLGILAIEVVLIYIASAVISTPTPVDLTAATVAWSFFSLFLSLTFGNIRSITAPKGLDVARVRSQNVNGLSSLVSLLVSAVNVALGALVLFLCSFLHASYWVAAGVFSLLGALSFSAYLMGLARIDDLAARHAENLTRELSKV
jgi:ABC-2 type transport system permease protein